jgi:hypothetical protein
MKKVRTEQEMKGNKLYSTAIAVIMVVAVSQRASAQLVDFYSSSGFTNFTNNLLSNHIWNASMENYTKNRGRSGASASSSSRASAPAAPPEVPAYRRYPAVQFKSTGTRLTLQTYLDSLSGATPQDIAEAKELVLKIFKEYETQAAAKGYPNDWALAYVSYVGLNSHIYNGITQRPIIPLEQNVGLRDVVAEYATDNGIFNGVTDQKKQQLYEFLVLFGGLTYYFYEEALRKNNAEELKNCKLAAAKNLKLLGIKP